MEDKTHTVIMMASIVSTILGGIALGVCMASLTTWVVGMFVDFPFTWSNVGKVYLATMLIGLLRAWWCK